VAGLERRLDALVSGLGQGMEDKHRAMLTDLHAGLTQQGDRIGASLTESSERLRTVVAEELRQTRDTLHALRLSLGQDLGQNREAMAQKLAETTQALTAKVEERLEQISGKVSERLDEGFKKTNETFVSVMQRLATIDEAQKKIESLTGSVVSLQELLGDKRSRGAFGRSSLRRWCATCFPRRPSKCSTRSPTAAAPTAYSGSRIRPGWSRWTRNFRWKNYHRMFDREANEADRSLAQKAFKQDVRRHVDAIAGKYIIANETSDGAVMFVPAEAVFARSTPITPTWSTTPWASASGSSRRRR